MNLHGAFAELTVTSFYVIAMTVMSVLALLVFIIDKNLARRGTWRISEAAL